MVSETETFERLMSENLRFCDWSEFSFEGKQVHSHFIIYHKESNRRSYLMEKLLEIALHKKTHVVCDLNEIWYFHQLNLDFE